MKRLFLGLYLLTHGTYALAQYSVGFEHKGNSSNLTKEYVEKIILSYLPDHIETLLTEKGCKDADYKAEYKAIEDNSWLSFLSSVSDFEYVISFSAKCPSWLKGVKLQRLEMINKDGDGFYTEWIIRLTDESNNSKDYPMMQAEG